MAKWIVLCVGIYVGMVSAKATLEHGTRVHHVPAEYVTRQNVCVFIHAYTITTHLTIINAFDDQQCIWQSTTRLTIKSAFDDQERIWRSILTIKSAFDNQERIWRSRANLTINFDDQERIWRSRANLTIKSAFDDQERIWRSRAHLTINNTFVVWWRMHVYVQNLICTYLNVHICKATLEDGVYACVCECVGSLMCTFCTVQQCACIVCLQDHNTVVVCNLVQLMSRFIRTRWAWEDN